MPGFRMTTTVARVLRLFLDDPAVPRYGFDVMQMLELPSGTLYPILARLENAGWIVGRREMIDPAEAGRPVRRMYLLTSEGAQEARYELARLSAQLKPPPWRGAARPGQAPV